MSGPSHRGLNLAREQIVEIASAGDAVQILAVDEPDDSSDALRIEVSLDCSGVPHRPDGLRLRARERFVMVIDGMFPFMPPAVNVPHTRWAGTPHVQWGSHLCIYAAPSIEWNPSDGMRGLIERLVFWLESASLGELDPDDQPLHPPVAYTSSSSGIVVLRADVGGLAPSPAAIEASRSSAGEGTVSVVAAIAQRHPRLDRFDVTSWLTLDELVRRHKSGELRQPGIAIAIGLLSDRELFFEYPKKAAELVRALEQVGLVREELHTAMAHASAANEELPDAPTEAVPLHLFVGTPSRRGGEGSLRQHLVCWRLDDLGRRISTLLNFEPSDNADAQTLRTEIEDLAGTWIGLSRANWIRVAEARREVTARRDSGSAAETLRGRRVLVLGAGALGAPIAESCVRSGASAVTVVDNGIITPGILVRQPYDDDDIGKSKAFALATRLNCVRTDQPATAIAADARTSALASDRPDFDLVIDATADASVAALIELRRSSCRDSWPPLLTVAIGHDARRGIVAVAPQGSTGAGRHLLRRLALSGLQESQSRLSDVIEDFFPDKPRTKLFQPEPGCSAPTFIGSAAELTALAGSLLDTGLLLLHESTGRGAIAAVRLSDTAEPQSARTTLESWADDLILTESVSGLEIRISRSALSEIHAECQRGARVRGPKIETGGLLLGEYDEACSCVWVDAATGPPPDSLLSATYFEHGIEGVEELIEHHRERSGGRTTFLGMWHSHPYGPASPSETDEIGMTSLVLPTAKAPRRALLVIVGGLNSTWTDWLKDSSDPDVYAAFVKPDDTAIRERSKRATGRPVVVGRSWGGGWSGPQPRPRSRRRRWPPWRWNR